MFFLTLSVLVLPIACCHSVPYCASCFYVVVILVMCPHTGEDTLLNNTQVDNNNNNNDNTTIIVIIPSYSVTNVMFLRLLSR